MDGPGDERLVNIVGALVLALTDRLQHTAETAAGHAAAAPAALVALHDLLAGRTVNDLRRAVGITHSGAVRLVDRLVEDGLAERRPGADGRTIAVVLTARGRRMARRILAARRSVLAEVLSVLEPRERAALVPITEKLVTAVVGDRLAERAAGADPAGGWLCRLCDPVACQRPDGRCPAATAAAALTEDG